MDLSQYGINSTTGSSTGLSIPGLDGIQNSLAGIQSILPLITIGSLVISVAFLVLYIIHIVHRWKVDKAVIETHKEVVAIHALLEGMKSSSAPVNPAIIEQPDTGQPAPALE